MRMNITGKYKSTGTRHFEPFLFLMVVTILVITGFQAYWLKNNYDREKRSMHIRANMAFQETVRQLQAAKLKLKDPFFPDSLHRGKARIFIDGDIQESDVKVKVLPRREIVTMVDAMRNKIHDSLKDARVNSAVVISMDKNGMPAGADSLPLRIQRRAEGDNRIFQFLYGVDSLQDSLRIPEITTAYTKRLQEENLKIPFRVLKVTNSPERDEPDFSQVTVGLVHPVTYHVELGNTVAYLMRRITLPILFSIFLVGVTIASFYLLYKNLLKQRRLAELKNDFISNVTHELKTPIATVAVAIEALRNFNVIDDPKRTKEYLDISANELQRLGMLVDKVLKLSMFEKKEVQLKKERFDMHELTREVLSIMKLQFDKHEARVSLEVNGSNFMIAGDRLHITSVLYNLLDNALKYGGDRPEIQVKLSALSNDSIELKLIDNGVGIAREYHTKIFEKFFRVPMGNHHNVKGYGLGLSYVSEIIRRHGGLIAIDSELGKGTAFTIVLPRNYSNPDGLDSDRLVNEKAMEI